MLKKLRTFLVAFLLVPVLAMNANAFTRAATNESLDPPQVGLCWFYVGGRWWLLPC